MIKPRAFKLIVLVLLLAVKSINAQLINNRGFSKITIENGLSNSVVYDILQDDDGFLWFASKDGLNKFDGINITKYSPTERSYQYAKDNIVFCLEQGPASSIYCATASGRIYNFNKNRDKFEKVNISGSSPLISPIWDLCSRFYFPYDFLPNIDTHFLLLEDKEIHISLYRILRRRGIGGLFLA